MFPNRYTPFPPGMRSDKRGAYHETTVDNGRCSRFIVIKPIRYMGDRSRELINTGIFNLMEIYPEIKILGHIPCDETFWLYRVNVFITDKKFQNNNELFFLNLECRNTFVFDKYENMLTFFSKKYNLKEKDFMKIWETNYPQS